jgi:hypothetical protein
MFLNFFKIFSAKRKLKNIKIGINPSVPDTSIRNIGLLVDGSNFGEVDSLIREIEAYGFDRQFIHVLLYKDRIKKKEELLFPHYAKRDVTWLGSIENEDAKEFKKQKFDLLISYYDVKKTPLIIVTYKSVADFKVGFASIDKKYNHFMIDTSVENHKVFVDELFKYLKILNKL